MTISQRLHVLVAAALLGLLLLTGINYVQMSQVYEKTNFGNVNVVPSIEILNKVVTEFGRLRVRVYRHALAAPEEKDAIENTILDSMSKVDAHLKRYEPLVINAEDQRLLDEGLFAA